MAGCSPTVLGPSFCPLTPQLESLRQGAKKDRGEKSKVSLTFQSLTGGELRVANVAELEAELSALWKTAAEDPEIHHAVTRSCALTLLAYVESEEAGREVLNLVDGVTPENPCRAVVMVAEREAAPAGLSAQIAARCHLPAAGEKEVCCEQISIRARGEAVHGLDQVVIPLMVPGLPVFLLWRAGRFSPAKFLDPILRASDHVLVDSARFPDPDTDLPRLFEQVRRLSDEVVFTDLNWARITPWRELVAQCFDSAETRPYLDRLSEVRVEYERDSPRVLVHRAQSLLLTGWLASRLHWEPKPTPKPRGSEGRSFLFSTGGGSAQVECLPRHFEGGGAGRCVSIRMSAGGDLPATFSLGRGPDGKAALTRSEISGRPPIERAVRLEVVDEVELINEEIKLAGRDQVYEEALGMIARLTTLSSSA